MEAFTEESLNKLPKQELVLMYLKVSKKMESLNDHLLEEVKHMRDTFRHMESELSIVKNVNSLLSKRLVDMERQCWANAQYSRRECLEVVGIPQSVKDDELENVVIQVANKVGVTICERDMQAVHRIGKEGRTIVKFSNRKDCQALLKVKRDLNKLTMKDFGYEENNKVFINESLCPYYRVLWAKCKRLHHLEKIFNFYVSNGSIKIKIHENDKGISITHTADFEKHFPRIDLSPPSQSF